jgi:hypothetical protein
MKTTFRLILIFQLIAVAVHSQGFVQSKDTRISLDSINTNDAELKDAYVDKKAVKTEMQKRFYENAKLAGLTEEKTNQLKKVLEERNSVLKKLDLWKEQLDDTFNLEDGLTLYTFRSTKYRNLYAKRINSLLTYQQFCYFVVDEYRDEAVENSQMEYQDLLKTNTGLNKDQKKKLYKLIYNYHLNQRLTKVYLSFDKKLQNPRLGILRANFEKDFAKICQEYGIKGADAATNSDNNFQWN